MTTVSTALLSFDFQRGTRLAGMPPVSFRHTCCCNAVYSSNRQLNESSVGLQYTDITTDDVIIACPLVTGDAANATNVE